jgi:hypothetical protein
MKKILAFSFCALTLLGATTAFAQASCPAGSRYATNGSNLAFCLFEGITPPAGATPYCDYLHLGYIGFDWPLSSAPEYQCPASARQTTNGADLGFCLYDSSSAATWASPYCNYLGYGYVGYSWLICPPGARLASNGADTEFCLFENLSLPRDAQPYCNYLQSGYEGFSFPLADQSGYVCPSGFRQTTNGADLGFCLIENLTIPANLNVQPYCDYLQSGYMGFSFSAHP